MKKNQFNEEPQEPGKIAASAEQIKEVGLLEAGKNPLSEQGLAPSPLEPDDLMGGILDDSLPSTPSPPSPEEIHRENAELELMNARIAECFREIWEPRLEREIYFEEFESLYEGNYHILFFRGQILVLSDDLARVLTLVDDLGPDAEYTAAEIINIVNVRDLIVVPGPEVPANFDGAFGGTYVPLEVLVSMLWDTDCAFGDDATDFQSLLTDFEKYFEEYKSWQQQWRRLNARSRELRLQALPQLEAELRSRKRKL
jgi:hypothetical protein